MKKFRIWLSTFLGTSARNSFSRCIMQLQGANRILIQEKAILEGEIARKQSEVGSFEKQIEANTKISESIALISPLL